jgi:hypothetical protein
VEIFSGAINALQTYETTSYVSSKGSKSRRRPKRKKCFIECKARCLYPMMKMRNYRRRQGVKLSFKEGRESAMSMVVEVGQGEVVGEGEYEIL